MKISQKEKIGLSIAAMALFLAIGDRLVFTPIQETLDKINRETKIVEKQLAAKLRNLGQKEFIKGEYQKDGLSLKENKSDDEVTASMLGAIEDLAKKSGVSLVDIKPQQLQNVDFYREITIEVHGQGSMESLVGFLYRLHSSPLLLRTESVHLELKDKNAPGIEALIKVTKTLI